MGKPSRAKPSLVEGMSGGRSTGEFASFSEEQFESVEEKTLCETI